MPLPTAPTRPGTFLKSLPEQLPERTEPPKRRKTKAVSAPKTEAPKAPAKRVSTRRPRAHAKERRLYVLDTNVLLHDPSCLFRFEEHDIYLPMITLEELDNHKSGMTDIARNARQVSRTLDALFERRTGPVSDGIELADDKHKGVSGRLFVQTTQFADGTSLLPQGKADNQILSVVAGLNQQNPQQPAVLVSKDINMRLKAAALGLQAEDYFNDKMIEDTDILYSGARQLPADFWETHGKGLKSWQKDGQTWYRITGPLVKKFLINEFIWHENKDGSTPFYAQVKSLEGDSADVRVVRDYTNPKCSVWGVTARNREQAFALSLLLDPEIDFVTLLGQAGTGKTLLALAAGLTQTMEARRFSEIIVTRATIAVGEDIGFLPGTEEEKMTPWLGAIDDNLEVLNGSGGHNSSEWSRRAADDLIRSRIRIKSMSFMRGRTFLNKFVIIDEAQNLTPKQMKTLITRAGPGTKIVCLGNIAQIDTPYLTEGSSGLTYVVDRFKGWLHAGHVTMQRGERSRLADFAAETL